MNTDKLKIINLLFTLVCFLGCIALFRFKQNIWAMAMLIAGIIQFMNYLKWKKESGNDEK